MAGSPRTLVQVPLDRVTQALYAKIYATMAPVRQALIDAQTVTEQWAAVLCEFRDGLPSLDLGPYVKLQQDVGVLADLFARAVRLPISETTKALTLQIVSHDLPRIAAIATKLNEEEAPKFFAAISKDEPEQSLKRFQTSDVRAKTRIRKSDLEYALTSIVNQRVEEAVRLMHEDLGKFFQELGVQGADFGVASEVKPAAQALSMRGKLFVIEDGFIAIVRQKPRKRYPISNLNCREALRALVDGGHGSEATAIHKRDWCRAVWLKRYPERPAPGDAKPIQFFRVRRAGKTVTVPWYRDVVGSDGHGLYWLKL